MSSTIFFDCSSSCPGQVTFTPFSKMRGIIIMPLLLPAEVLSSEMAILAAPTTNSGYWPSPPVSTGMVVVAKPAAKLVSTGQENFPVVASWMLKPSVCITMRVCSSVGQVTVTSNSFSELPFNFTW